MPSSALRSGAYPGSCSRWSRWAAPSTRNCLTARARWMGAAVPDHQQLIREVAQQVAQEVDHLRAVQRLLPYHLEEATVRRDAADGRQMIARQGHAEDRGLPARGVGARPSGQEVEAGFIDPDDRPPVGYRPLCSAGQRSVDQVWTAASSRWLARTTGCCGLQSSARRRRLTWAGW